MLVDAIHCKSVEHVKRTHPLRVALCKVVVDGNHVYAVSCQGIEEYRQCRNECLTLTGCHLGNLSFVKNYTTEQLYIVVYHVPYGIVSACLPMVTVYGLVAVDCHEIEVCCKITVCDCCRYNNLFVLCKTACAVLDNGKSLGKGFVECFVELLKHLFLQFVYLVENSFSLFELCLFYACFQFCNSCTFYSDCILYFLFQSLCRGTQLIVAHCCNSGIDSLYLFYPRLNLTHVSACFVAE